MFAVEYATEVDKPQETSPKRADADAHPIPNISHSVIRNELQHSELSEHTLFDSNQMVIHKVSRQKPDKPAMPFSSCASIQNAAGHTVFWATEENTLRTAIGCCGSCSPFDMQVLDTHGSLVIQMTRSGDCSMFCFPCCMPSMRVESPPGVFIGSVQQMCTIIGTKYAIKSKNGYTVMMVQGPCRFSSVNGNTVYKIKFTGSGRKVGSIHKRWSGLRVQMFSHDHKFAVTFPAHLDANMKALLVATIFCL